MKRLVKSCGCIFFSGFCPSTQTDSVLRTGIHDVADVLERVLWKSMTWAEENENGNVDERLPNFALLQKWPIQTA